MAQTCDRTIRVRTIPPVPSKQEEVQTRGKASLKGLITAARASSSRVAPIVQFVRKAATFEFMQRLMLSSTCNSYRCTNNRRTPVSLLHILPFPKPFRKARAEFENHLETHLDNRLCERLVDPFFAGSNQNELFDRCVENLQTC